MALPGGTKLTFKDRLAKADVEVEIVKEEVAAEEPPPLQPEEPPVEAEVHEKAEATDETDATVRTAGADHRALRGAQGLDHKKFLELARVSPAAAVVETWRDVEALLLEIRSAVPNAPRRWNLRAVVRQLVSWNLLSENAFELYDTMRGARNLAAHPGSSVSTSDAIRFRRQAIALRSVLLRAFDRYKENPRSWQR